MHAASNTGNDTREGYQIGAAPTLPRAWSRQGDKTAGPNNQLLGARRRRAILGPMRRLGAMRFAVLVFASGAFAACGTFLALDDFEVVEREVGSDAGSDAGSDTCWLPDGSGHGNPCFACSGGLQPELLNACTTRGSFWFDDRGRISGYDAGRPPLPEGGVEEPPVADATPGTASVLCKNLPGKPVYVVGSTALGADSKSVMAKFSAALAATGAARIVYQKQTSCRGFDIMVNGEPLTGTAKSWDASGAETECSFDKDEHADIGLSDVGGGECHKDFAGLPPDIEAFSGPVQVFMFITHKDSSQEVISYEAAHRVYGWGGTIGPAPWTVPKNILKRSRTSGTQIVIGRSIDLDAEDWRGVPIASSGGVLDALVPLTPPDSTLAITSADVADVFENRQNCKLLAYQHAGQYLGFLPDTDRGSWDKRNVRDGHYALWEPLHIFARKGGAKATEITATRNLLRGVTVPEKLEYIPALKVGGLVPPCAMRVDRDSTTDKLIPYRSDVPCHCAFEKALPSSPIACSSCAAGEKCPEGTSCRRGLCEAP